MAAPTLSTSVSRRTMIAGGTATVLAVPGLHFPVAAARSAALDARLLRRIAVAKRLRKQHARACRLLDRLRESLRGDPDYSELPGVCLHSLRWDAAWRTGRRGLMLQRSALFRRYATAVRGAVGTPAHTLHGIHAKLGLAVIASRWGDARIYLYEDQEWLRLALDDLNRLARSGTVTPAKAGVQV